MPMPRDDEPPNPVQVSAVYDELHALAAQQLRGQPAGHTLQATALVHEAWMRLARRDAASFADRAHFFAIAVKAMRHVLVDHARRVRAAKRGGDQHRVTLVTADGGAQPQQPTDVLDLDRALVRLEQQSERQARVVELRFFGGLSIPEIAATLEVSHMTVSNDWRRARVWLARELGT